MHTPNVHLALSPTTPADATYPLPALPNNTIVLANIISRSDELIEDFNHRAAQVLENHKTDTQTSDKYTNIRLSPIEPNQDHDRLQYRILADPITQPTPTDQLTEQLQEQIKKNNQLAHELAVVKSVYNTQAAHANLANNEYELQGIKLHNTILAFKSVLDLIKPLASLINEIVDHSQSAYSDMDFDGTKYVAIQLHTDPSFPSSDPDAPDYKRLMSNLDTATDQLTRTIDMIPEFDAPTSTSTSNSKAPYVEPTPYNEAN